MATSDVDSCGRGRKMLSGSSTDAELAAAVICSWSVARSTDHHLALAAAAAAAGISALSFCCVHAPPRPGRSAAAPQRSARQVHRLSPQSHYLTCRKLLMLSQNQFSTSLSFRHRYTRRLRFQRLLLVEVSRFLMRRLQLRLEFDSTATRPPFDFHSTKLRPCDAQCYDRRPTCCGLLHCGLNK